MNKFLDEVKKLLEIVTKEEINNIIKTANLMYQTFKEEKLVHVFATGHSHMFAEELFYRSGGLAQINPILIPELMQHEGAVRSTYLERETARAKKIFDALDLKENEPFIIVSNSGINCVPVEMAELAKANNHPVVVITSVDASKMSKARTLNGKKLYEVSDIVIDNHVPYSDGVFNYSGTKIGAVSSIIGSFIAQSLVLEVIKLYDDHKEIPPIYQSANTPGGDEHNKKLYEKYQKRIKCLY